MGLVKCPNCGKETFDDYKCGYCKYVLRKKENKFDTEMYSYLYEEYFQARNKAQVVKKGMSKFNKPMQEIKNIVDYIADEVFEQENYKSKEELGEHLTKVTYNDFSKVDEAFSLKKSALLLLTILLGLLLVFSVTRTDSKMLITIFAVSFMVFLTYFSFSLLPKENRINCTYYYSFVQYFIHDFIYKILIMVLIFFVPIILLGKFELTYFDITAVGVTLYIIEVLLLLVYMYMWAKTSTSSFTIDYGNVVYRYQKLNGLSGQESDRFPELAWSHYVEYSIVQVYKIKESMNSIIIYGKIIKSQTSIQIAGKVISYKPKEYEKIVIRKCFKNNRELINNLKRLEKK